MPLSNATAPWRVPRLRVLVNGTRLAAAIDADVVSNNHYAADRCNVTLALHGEPVRGAAFWSSESDIAIDIQFSLDDGAGFTSLMQGTVDTVVLDPVQGIARLAGRDRSAALIAARTQETFANQTASDIATLLAQRHGLIAQVQATSTPVGRYFQNESDQITLDQFSQVTTEWDLLCRLARHEGFDVFVQGSTLYFQPALASLATVLLAPTDLIDLRLERSLSLARDIAVTVKSWNNRRQAAFVETARAPCRRSAAASGSAGSPQCYVFVVPNLTPDQALQCAQRKLAELTRHERVIELTMPGDLTLTARSVIQLTGTGTDFDQIYYVDTIERRLGPVCGFVQHVRATNTSPRDTTSGDTD